MPDEIADLAAERQNSTAERLRHPAGVTLPFDGSSDAALIIPEIRGEIRSGAYSADLVRLLPEAVIPGDRVLVIGAGLGVVSTLIARNEGVWSVIAVEANTALIPYLNRVHIRVCARAEMRRDAIAWHSNRHRTLAHASYSWSTNSIA